MANKVGTLYVVALPIGNPDDITLRAIKVLQSVNYVAAEDTREFKKLANHHNISPEKLISYHEHNESESAEGILKLLDEGLDVAIVSDAGTPGLSDPGFRVSHLAFERHHSVVPIPGPSAVTTLLSVCPIGGTGHIFLGFLSAKKLRKEISEIKSLSGRVVVFEAPHRILEHLELSLEILGDIEIFIGRELTKTHEEFYHGKVSGALKKFTEHKPLGEFVMVYNLPESGALDENLDDWLRQELEKGISPRDLLKDAQKMSTLSRRDLFNKIQEIKNSLPEK